MPLLNAILNKYYLAHSFVAKLLVHSVGARGKLLSAIKYSHELIILLEYAEKS